jgi:hypothetical protein
VVECLPSKCGTLNSNPSTTKNKQKQGTLKFLELFSKGRKRLNEMCY